MQTKVFEPKSYCFGVSQAIKKAIDVAHKNPNKNVYLLGKIVNNDQVIKDLAAQNIKTIDVSANDFPTVIGNFTPNDIVIFSAHGHDAKLENILLKNKVTFYNTTCATLLDNFIDVRRNVSLFKKVIFVGIKGHQETVAFLSISNKIFLYDVLTNEFPKNLKGKIYIAFQSTLSKDTIELAEKNIRQVYPNSYSMTTVCDVTQIRQKIVTSTPDDFDLIVIVGSLQSSNSSRLYDIAKSTFPSKVVIQVSTPEELIEKKNEIINCKKAAIYSGTSTPIKSILEVENYLKTI